MSIAGVAACDRCQERYYERGLYPGPDNTRLCWHCTNLVAFPCPECAGEVCIEYTCHTYETGGTWWACQGCDSARHLYCTEFLRDDIESTCRWSYTIGLNPENPRAAANDLQRPPWLGEFTSSS